MISLRSGSSWVVSTLASHARDPGFKPRASQILFLKKIRLCLQIRPKLLLKSSADFQILRRRTLKGVNTLESKCTYLPFSEGFALQGLLYSVENVFLNVKFAFLLHWIYWLGVYSQWKIHLVGRGNKFSRVEKRARTKLWWTNSVTK